jgi:hypothetical protein
MPNMYTPDNVVNTGITGPAGATATRLPNIGIGARRMSRRTNPGPQTFEEWIGPSAQDVQRLRDPLRGFSAPYGGDGGGDGGDGGFEEENPYDRFKYRASFNRSRGWIDPAVEPMGMFSM